MPGLLPGRIATPGGMPARGPRSAPSTDCITEGKNDNDGNSRIRVGSNAKYRTERRAAFELVHDSRGTSGRRDRAADVCRRKIDDLPVSVRAFSGHARTLAPTRTDVFGRQWPRPVFYRR